MIPTNRIPAHPGEVLLEEFLMPMEMTQSRLAEQLGIPVQRVNEVVNGRRGITPDSALMLAGVFKTSPEFWMNLQAAHDLALAHREALAQSEQLVGKNVIVVTNAVQPRLDRREKPDGPTYRYEGRLEAVEPDGTLRLVVGRARQRVRRNLVVRVMPQK